MARDYDYYFAQLRRIEEHREEKAEKEIRKIYKGILKDTKQFIAEEYYNLAEDGKLTFEILRSKGQDARFLQEVETRLSDLSLDVSKEIRQTTDEMFKLAYEGVKEAVEKGTDTASFFEGVSGSTEHMMKATVNNPIMEIALEKNHKEIVWDIKREVARSLMVGDRFDTMAHRVADNLNRSYKKAVLISRTEVGRVREAGHLASAKDLNETLKKGSSGMQMVKKWKSMGDGRVRDQHGIMDGTVVLMDEMFELPDGVETAAPKQSGAPQHDCNCRCTCLYPMMDDKEYFKATGKHFAENTENTVAKNENGDKIEADETDALPMSTYFNHSDPIYEYAKKVKSIKGYEDVFIHGDADGFSIFDADGRQAARYTPRDFADILRQDPNYRGGDIRLCSCGTGAADSISAKTLAYQLGVNILAPSDTLWILPDGGLSIGAKPTSDTGKWILFKGRK